jgi:hypothetical protein
MDYERPAVAGVEQRWGRSVFHCPFCHGWEVRDRRLGVLGVGPDAARRALLLREWSETITLYTNGPAGLDQPDLGRLRAAGVDLEERPVVGLLGPAGELTAIRLSDGAERECRGLLLSRTEASVTKPRSRGKTSRRNDTPPPRTTGDEKDVLVEFLDYLRASIAAKVDGVREPDVRAPGVRSGTNLLGLVKHLTSVERSIFLGEPVASWPATFHAGGGETPASVLAAYREATGRANQRIAACVDLTDPAHTSTTRKAAPSMRWALVHMIEETARHAGHADILRELLDGTTGR